MLKICYIPSLASPVNVCWSGTVKNLAISETQRVPQQHSTMCEFIKMSNGTKNSIFPWQVTHTFIFIIVSAEMISLIAKRWGWDVYTLYKLLLHRKFAMNEEFRITKKPTNLLAINRIRMLQSSCTHSHHRKKRYFQKNFQQIAGKRLVDQVELCFIIITNAYLFN